MSTQSSLITLNEEERFVSREEDINLALRAHQSSVNVWDFHAIAADLHQWAGRFILEFKLQIGVPALCIERLKGRYGHFRLGRNGFGLLDEVAIDDHHLRNSPYWRVCGTLLHELLHSWQQRHGRSGRRNYHNKDFRKMALSLGLVVDARGLTDYTPGDTPFFEILKRHGLTPPDVPDLPHEVVSSGTSRLRLFQCPCGVKVRVGRPRFNARCLECGGLFALQ